MQSFITRMRENVLRFMQGRYGADQLSLVLMVIALLFSFIAIPAGRWASIVSLVLLALVIFRMLSTNIAARQRENETYRNLVGKPIGAVRQRVTMWKNRDTKAYVRCPHCHTQFALPKGKGKLRATCPKCGEKSIHTV